MPIDIEKLEDSPHLLDILLQMEDILDSLDIYVFKNWIDGILVSGPDVRRHWLDMTLKFPYEKMPDPRAALRLFAQGIRVTYTEAAQEGDHAPAQTATDDPDSTNEKIWLVEIEIPRRLITEMNAGSLETYEDDIDETDVKDAQDSGVTDETGFSDEGADAGDDPTGFDDVGQDDADAPAAGQGGRQNAA